MLEIHPDRIRPASKGIVNIGEPVRPGSDFYSTARAFREAVDKLGLKQAVVVREVVAPLTEMLSKIRLVQGIRKIRILVRLEIERDDGSLETLAPEGMEEIRRALPTKSRRRGVHK